MRPSFQRIHTIIRGTLGVSPWAFVSAVIGIYFLFSDRRFSYIFLSDFTSSDSWLFLPISLLRNAIDSTGTMFALWSGLPLFALTDRLSLLLILGVLPVIIGIKGLREVSREEIRFKLFSYFLAIIGIIIGSVFVLLYSPYLLHFF